MASPADNLAASLTLLKALQENGRVAIRGDDLPRLHRERLSRLGFLQEVMRGWYVSARPDEAPGESTAWYASFWGFCADYLNERFGAGWCLSPEQSLSLHAGDWTVPKQLLVRSPKGGNKPIALLHGTSIFDARLALPPDADMEMRDGLRMMTLPAALVDSGPGQFIARPTEMRAALAMVRDPSDVLRRLLDGGHSKIAGRLAGAFRNIGRNQMAGLIVETLRSAGFTIQETDPFEDEAPIAFSPRETSPHVNRLRLLWAHMREPILKVFPSSPGLPRDAGSYMKAVKEAYVSDAYHSLSIEGYRVSEELIERVRSGNWNPDGVKADGANKDALAARGYWQAFRLVERSIGKVLKGENAGAVVERDHVDWYRELFGPSVAAGILKARDLAGYRNGAVYIRKSMHVPPRQDAVRDLMPAYFELLADEDEPAVRAVLGHWVFVYIHPYFDGNGRMGRFLMNTLMAAGGYPWTIIPVDRRNQYMASLEAASVEQNIEVFARFLATLVSRKR
jgi:Fic/DOC family